MTQDLGKWTNQARFILMIIEGKLVVSKKKKVALVQELREKNFKPISKSNDAMKDKNLDPLADEDEEKEHEEDADLGAADYDYLLSMPIWSLTKERIDRLQKQIGEREEEVDKLSKLTPQDIWKQDLDDFIHEWQFQLQDEADRQKKAAKLGRRASRKVNVGVGGRKHKVNNSDDSDFDAAPKAKKSTTSKPLPGGMLNYLVDKDKTKKPSKPKGPTATQKFAQKAISQDWFGTSASKEGEQAAKSDDDDIWMSLDGITEAKKPKAPTALKKSAPKPKELAPSNSDIKEEEIARPAAGYKPRRAAASKPAKYNLSDSDDSDGDFDVGAMVKGIDTVSASAENSRPLFSTSNSRPGSSAGLPRKSTTARDAFGVDANDTDYTKLAPPTTSKGPAVTARKAVLSDDDDNGDDSLLASFPPAKAKTSKPPPPQSKPITAKSSKPAAAKPPKPTKKRDPTPQPAPAPKPTALSPAAKAYAAKKAKSLKQPVEKEVSQMSDDEDEIEKAANKILDDDDDDDDEDDVVIAKPRAAAARPGRAAAAKAASKTKKYALSDDDEEDDEDEDEEEESEEDFEADESFD